MSNKMNQVLDPPDEIFIEVIGAVFAISMYWVEIKEPDSFTDVVASHSLCFVNTWYDYDEK